jgi:hypothetical protein
MKKSIDADQAETFASRMVFVQLRKNLLTIALSPEDQISECPARPAMPPSRTPSQYLVVGYN